MRPRRRKPRRSKRVAKKTAGTRKLHDNIVARTCRLADAMLRMSGRHIRELWDLGNTDMRLLNILDCDTPLTVNEISSRSLVDQAWVSRSLRALEARKLVARQGDPNDSRVTLVTLTARGRRIIDESRPYAKMSERMLLEGIDEERLKACLDQLEANTRRSIELLESSRKMLAKRRSKTPAARGG